MKITGVAIVRDGITYQLPAPNRHGDVIVEMVKAGVPKPVTKDAFIGKFVRGSNIEDSRWSEYILGLKYRFDEYWNEPEWIEYVSKSKRIKYNETQY
jgi:hypothetical protein